MQRYIIGDWMMVLADGAVAPLAMHPDVSRYSAPTT